MKSRWSVLAGAAALSVMGFVASGAAGAAAGPGAGRGFRGPHHGGGFGLLEDARLLDLSDEQRAAVKDLFRQHHDAARPLMEKERDLHRQLRDAASQKDADPAKVGRIAIDAYKMGEQMRAERKKLEEAFVALLTPEQKDMWTKIQASREKERERWKEGRGFDRQPGEDGPDPDAR